MNTATELQGALAIYVSAVLPGLIIAVVALGVCLALAYLGVGGTSHR